MTIRGFFQWVGLLLLTLVAGPPAMLLGLLIRSRDKKEKVFRRLSKLYCGIAMWMLRVKVESRGISKLDPDKGYVFLPTHTSNLDPGVLAIVLTQPLLWVFKKELAKIPIFGWVLMQFGQIKIDRSDVKQARSSMSDAGNVIAGNTSVVVFPEGTRSKDGKLKALKKGGFHMALELGLPIVPIRIHGSYELFPYGAQTVRPGCVVVELFDPIPVHDKTEADIPKLVSQVKAALLSGTTGP